MITQPSNRISNFWQELKRRKVVRVITVYAAAAFVILELVDILAPSLGLPAWTLNFIIILLCVGFIITVIVSWVYDVTPEGLEKTEPAQKVKEEEKHPSSKGWKIASYISFVVIVALIVLNIIPRTNQAKGTEILDKSIAVLPFTSLSDDPEKQYLADGAMDAILLHLSKIEDLRVMARTSVEQYRETDKTATMICQELDVAYLLEGSFQKYGDQARLIVQLIQSGKEGHIWANNYDREWKDIFTVQSEVAQLVAKELQVVITPEEKQLMEKNPTTNLLAYEFYQKGEEELSKYKRNDNDITALNKAENLFQFALEYDSSFALAYTGLAETYIEKNYFDEYLNEGYLDTVLHFATVALEYDEQLADAYALLGQYHFSLGNSEKAIEQINKALKYNPNDAYLFSWLGWLYQWGMGDNMMAIKNFHAAEKRYGGEDLSSTLNELGIAYLDVGFVEKAKSYYKKALEIREDTVDYLSKLSWAEFSNEDFQSALAHREELWERYSDKEDILPTMIQVFSFAAQHEKAYKYASEYINAWESGEILLLTQSHRIGYALWMGGNQEESKYYFDQQIRYGLESIELGRSISSRKAAHYDLAAVYAFQDEKSKAYEYLREVTERQTFPLWWRMFFRYDPLLEKIRNDPEFQQIVRDVEAKYQAEHERVRQWLEENNML